MKKVISFIKKYKVSMGACVLMAVLGVGVYFVLGQAQTSIGDNIHVIGNLTTDGDVGIGTNSPGAKLRVVGDGSDLVQGGTTPLLILQTTENSKFSQIYMMARDSGGVNRTAAIAFDPDNNTLSLANGAMQALNVSGGGNVGIGTVSPDNKLDVNGDIRLSAADSKIRIKDANGHWHWFEQAINGSSGIVLRTQNNQQEIFQVQSAGGAVRFAVYHADKTYVADNLEVGGTLTKGSGSFLIDHPLDPKNKTLKHSFVESPDMMNIYNGNVVTDKEGYALIKLPDYFEALNNEFRYQLTVVGDFAQAIIAEEIENNKFVIHTDKPEIKVSWQVTGVRQDAFAQKNPIIVEEEKGNDNDFTPGEYIHPGAFKK